MKTKKDWAERYWRVVCPAGFDGHPKRRAVYCGSKQQATDLRWRIRKWKADRKNPPTWNIEITEDDKRRIAGLKAEIGDLSLLPRIVEHWRKTSYEAVQKMTVADVVDQFLAWRPGQGGWTRATAEDTQSRLGIFKTAFAWRDMHTLTASEIERFLVERGRSQTKYFNKLRPLFRYAQRNRHIAINPLDNIEPPKPEYREIQIYTPDELSTMLVAAERLAPDLAPCIACLAFGFLRTEELIPRYAGDTVLNWSAFDWTERQIFVPHVVAKRARAGEGNDRSIPITEALEHWLKPYVQSSGQVVRRDKIPAMRALAKIRKDAGSRPLQNGLRHSCISYYLAANGETSFGTVARWSGNSPAIIKRHYLAVIKRTEGQRWFSIRRVR
jgi:hypothetical protein